MPGRLNRTPVLAGYPVVNDSGLLLQRPSGLNLGLLRLIFGSDPLRTIMTTLFGSTSRGRMSVDGKSKNDAWKEVL